MNKIKTIEELTEIVKTKKFSLCSGCFDLLHIGHIKHLQKAKKLTGLLVVSVTSDSFINKGPGRPVFSQDLRMEQLQALSCVDYILLNNDTDVVKIINILKPTFYVKGSEYRDESKDLNGKIKEEREAVKKNKGELFYTDEVVFSSTKLVNDNIDFLKPTVKSYLKGFKSRYNFSVIEDTLKSMKKLNVLIVGDIIFDEYKYCQVLGTTTKYPSLSTLHSKTELMPGGVLAIHNNLKGFVNKVQIVSTIGYSHNNKYSHFIPYNSSILYSGKITNKKTRYISSGYPNPLINVERVGTKTRLFEVSNLRTEPLEKHEETEVIETINEIKEKFDLVIVADFGHGFITPRIFNYLRNTIPWMSLNVQTNSSNYGFNLVTKYNRPDFVCIDELESRLPFGERKGNLTNIASMLQEKLECKNILITHGQDGQTIFMRDKEYNAPALNSETIDTVGAGDAVLSITSLCSCLKTDPELTVFIGSCFGAIYTNIIGNKKPITKNELLKYIKGILE